MSREDGVVPIQRGSLCLPVTQAQGFPGVLQSEYMFRPGLKKAVMALVSVISITARPSTVGTGARELARHITCIRSDQHSHPARQVLPLVCDSIQGVPQTEEFS